MTHRAARIAVAILLALSLRAALIQSAIAQQELGAPQYPRANYQTLPPFQFQQPPQQPGPQYQQPQWQPPPPAANQALRYPLPNTAPPGSPPARPAPQQPFPQIMNGAPVTPATSISAVAPPIQPQPVLFAPGQIVARVGDKTILYCDVAPTVNMIMASALSRATTEAERRQLESSREVLTKNVIQQVVQNKLLYMEFERGMPPEMRTDAKKRAEMESKRSKIIGRAFDETLAAYRERLATASSDEIDSMLRQDGTIVRLALLMKERHLESPGELDIALREFGTSLQQQVRDYGEYLMGMEAARTAIMSGGKKPDPKSDGKPKKQEVTHLEMLDYYQAHAADYYIPAKARFEILTARFSNFRGDRNAAYNHIVMMGNEVVVGGTPFPAIARKFSQEPHASDGGKYDWVNPGSLASKPLDQAIFSIEVDRLSQIIEDDQGFHILHVLERKPAGQISFQEAQPAIREAIDKQRRSAEQQKFFVNLKTRTKVWTIFDVPEGAAPQGSAPASTARGPG